MSIDRIWLPRQTSVWSTFSRWARHTWVFLRSLPHLSHLGLSGIQVAESQLPFLSALLTNAGGKLCPLSTATTFVCAEVVSEGFSPSQLAAQKLCTAKIHICMHGISPYCHFFWSHCEVTVERGKWGQAVLAEGSEEKKLWVILCGKLN